MFLQRNQNTSANTCKILESIFEIYGFEDAHQYSQAHFVTWQTLMSQSLLPQGLSRFWGRQLLPKIKSKTKKPIPSLFPSPFGIRKCSLTASDKYKFKLLSLKVLISIFHPFFSETLAIQNTLIKLVLIMKTSHFLCSLPFHLKIILAHN